MTSQQIASILDYHVLPELVYSTGLTNGTVLKTKNGVSITARQAGNNRYINSAQLLQTDIMIANGVIHLIDNVLNPLGPLDVPNPDATAQGVAYPSATSVKNLPFTSNIPCTTSGWSSKVIPGDIRYGVNLV